MQDRENRELAAQVAVMVERIKEAQLRLPDQLDDIHELLCKALTNLPAEAEKLVRLVEAVGTLLHPPINSAIYMVVNGTDAVCGPDLEGLRIAYRDLRGGDAHD